MNVMRLERFIPKGKSLLFNLLLISLMLGMVVHPAQAGSNYKLLYPPDARPFGKTMGRWTANSLIYAYSQPASTNPWLDPTGANCANGQSGPVFFLYIYTMGDSVKNDCAIPAGKTVFLQLVGYYCSVPEDGPNLAYLKTFCPTVADHIDVLKLTVDGEQIENVRAYRYQTPPFAFTGAIPSAWRQPGCVEPCYEGYHADNFGDGYAVMLRPLSPGKHTITWTWHIDDPDIGFNWGDTTTYNINMKKQ